jgi:hypothetical protein
MLIDETLDKNALYANLHKIVNSSAEKTIRVDSEDTIFRLSCLPKQQMELNLISILGLSSQSELPAEFKYFIKFCSSTKYENNQTSEQCNELNRLSDSDDQNYMEDYCDDIIEL